MPKDKEIRDKLCMQLLEWRQAIRDCPEQNLPEIACLLQDTEHELRRLAQ